MFETYVYTSEGERIAITPPAHVVPDTGNQQGSSSNSGKAGGDGKK